MVQYKPSILTSMISEGMDTSPIVLQEIPPIVL